MKIYAIFEKTFAIISFGMLIFMVFSIYMQRFDVAISALFSSIIALAVSYSAKVDADSEYIT